MKRVKDTEIYPKFEFRLSHRERAWLLRELEALKEKFNGDGEHPAVTKSDILVGALRHGLRHLKAQRRL